MVTVTGSNVNSVAEPVMVVTVTTLRGVNVYYQVGLRHQATFTVIQSLPPVHFQCVTAEQIIYDVNQRPVGPDRFQIWGA